MKQIFKTNYRKKMLLSFLATLLVPLMILGTLYYQRSASDVIRSATRLQEEMLAQAIGMMEEGIAQVEVLATTMAQSRWVRKIAHMVGDTIDYERLDPYTLMEYSDFYAQAEKGSSFTEFTTLFFTQKNYAMTGNAPGAMQSTLEQYYCLDREDAVNMLSIIVANEDQVFFYPQQGKSWQLFVAQRLPLDPQRINVQLLAPIRKSTLTRILNTAGSGYPAYLYHDGQLILSNASFPAMDEMIENWSGAGTLQVDGESYSIFSQSSEQTGWQIVSCIPTSAILAGVNSVRNFVWAMWLGALMLGVVLVILLMRRAYQPVAHLSKVVLPDDASDFNELDAIEQAFLRLAQSEAALGQKVNEFSPLAREAFLLKALSGTPINDQMMTLARTLGIVVHPGKWVVAIRMYAPNTGYVMENAHQDNAYLVRFGANRLVCVACAADYALACESAQALCAPGGETVGLSGPHDSIADVAQAYIEATIALEYASEGPSLYPELGREYNISYDYSAEDETVFVGYLRSGDAEKVRAWMGTLIKRNAGGSNFTMRCLQYHLITALLRVGRNDQLESIVTNDSTVLLARGDLNAYLGDMITRICEAEQEQAAAKQGVDSELKAYIQAHYTEPDLSLTRFAEAFGVTPQHISRLYRKATGMSFLDTVARLRVEDAKLRILKGDESLDAIAQAVGFETPVSFRRAFKKLEGINPSEYRAARK